MKSFSKYTLLAILGLTAFAACKKEYEGIEQIDDRNVTAYIQQNNLSQMQQYQNTGMFYQVLTPGSGAEMKYSDKVPLVFTVRSLDGQYSSQDTFMASNRYIDFLGYFQPEGMHTILKEGLKNSGGTIRIIIPSRLAYGRNGSGSIPGNASLDVVVHALEASKMPQYDDLSINKYMQANNLSGFTKTNTGLYYKISDPGTGSPITVDSTVSAEYTGKLFNGKIFDQAVAGKANTFKLSEVIPAWQQAIPLLKKGGSMRILVPSALAYGDIGSANGYGQSIIPPFSCLDFDVKVTEVKR